MNASKSPLLALLVYLVLDSSISMDIGENSHKSKSIIDSIKERKSHNKGCTVFESALEFLPLLVDELEKSSVAADKLRIEVITFDDEAEVVFRLGIEMNFVIGLRKKELPNKANRKVDRLRSRFQKAAR